MTDKQETEKKTVHMSCRAKHPVTGESKCEGTEALIVSAKRSSSTGTRHATYKCMTCGRSFTVPF